MKTQLTFNWVYHMLDKLVFSNYNTRDWLTECKPVILCGSLAVAHHARFILDCVFFFPAFLICIPLFLLLLFLPLIVYSNSTHPSRAFSRFCLKYFPSLITVAWHVYNLHYYLSGNSFKLMHFLFSICLKRKPS